MLTHLKERLLVLPFYLLPHHAVSWLMFKAARIEQVFLKNHIIALYTWLNPVNMQEAVEEDRFAYPSLNAFFTRALKPAARPLDEQTASWVCPVDGAVSQAQPIKNGQVFQAKGHNYSLLTLLGGDRKLASTFANGNFATLYLSPRDYHRIHMPTTGTLKKMIYIPGRLFSVANFTVNTVPGLFARNERCVCEFETDDGPMVMILVGAINVSAMETVWHDGIIRSAHRLIKIFPYYNQDITLQRGEEMGRFNLGSTVIVLTPAAVKLDEQIKAGNTVKLGQRLACKTDEQTT